MDFRIADTFTNSLFRLTGDEQKAAKTTAFDLQLNPANPGMSFHKLDKARDKHFWSVRVSRDIRLIVHKSSANLLLCYVDHHDKAYDWAERRKLETHPETGAAQLVVIRETVQEIFVPIYVQEESKKAKVTSKPLFAQLSEQELLSYGVPPEWLPDVKAATEENYLALADHLPSEAAEALLELATGGKPRISTPAEAATSPFEHPDAMRRFRVMTNAEELKRALDFPWEKWTVFLHPEQKQWVERDYSGPARVSGSAGTGKTVVALHRAVFLAQANPDARVLLTTFSDTLARALRTKLNRLVGDQPRLGERLDVYSFQAIALRLYKAHLGQIKLVDPEMLKSILQQASQEIPGHKFSFHFLSTEWNQIVDAWHLTSWEQYRDVARLGRKTRLPEAQRSTLWAIFEKVRESLKAKSLATEAEMFTTLAAALSQTKSQPFDFVVVDEAQDIGIAHLRFFEALGASRPNALFFAGDLGQRIFQQPFSWRSLGVDIRGRSRTLRINYRTSHQIRTQADQLLGPEVSDVDGNKEVRSDAISVFNGPPPLIRLLADEKTEAAEVASWLSNQTQAGVLPHEIGVFVRSEAQIDRAKTAVHKAGLLCKVLDENVETVSGSVAVSTLHLAKGLEFLAVVVMACDDEVLPLQSRIDCCG